MYIYLQYGAYSHAVAEASVQISRSAMLADNGIPYANLVRWDIEGTLIYPQASLTAVINSLIDAYSISGQDAYLRFADGSYTSHALTRETTWGGVRVVKPPSFPQGGDTEYANCRTFAISLEAEERIITSGAGIIHWEERIEMKGTGGPRRAVIEVLNGYPQEQVTTTNSIVTAMQTGSATGLFFYPTAPPPVWPEYEQVSERTITATSPRALGHGLSRTYREYSRTWSYSFVSSVLMPGGLPALQPDI